MAFLYLHPRRDPSMPSQSAAYPRFLERLKGYERLEPLPRSRGVEKLAGVKALADALGRPERGLAVVHVAGTNGKGMTATMIARLLEQAGHPTGLYTSPHVADLRERIVLRGAPIESGVFARAGHRVLDVADRLASAFHFSYFDLLTLIGLTAFQEQGLRWAVLETGLGGLSDATNMVEKKALCVLTRIGLDHLHVLGENLKAIASQKLGIVRAGVPTVLGAQPSALADWMREQLAALGSPLLEAREFEVQPQDQPGPTVSLSVGRGGPWPAPQGMAPAAFTQPLLACTANALAAAEALLGPAQGEAFQQRLNTCLTLRLPGRLELRRQQPLAGLGASLPDTGVLGRVVLERVVLERVALERVALERVVLKTVVLDTVVLDGGHNPDALEILGAQLSHWGIGSYTLLLSLQSDKLVAALRPPLRRLLRDAERVITLAPQTVRAPSSEALRAYLTPLLPAAPGAVLLEEAASPGEALLRCAETPARALVVTGSLWMVGDVIRLLDAKTGSG